LAIIRNEISQNAEEKNHHIVLDGFPRTINMSVCNIDVLIQLFGSGNAFAESLIHPIASGPLPRTPILQAAIVNVRETNLNKEIC
jgi:hypothetical protein